MEALGIPCSEQAFPNATTALLAAKTVSEFVDKFGTRVTVLELLGAGSQLEILGLTVAMSAALVVGAIIGSTAVALGRCASDGATIADGVATLAEVFSLAAQHNLNKTWVVSLIARHPATYDTRISNRRGFRHATA